MKPAKVYKKCLISKETKQIGDSPQIVFLLRSQTLCSTSQLPCLFFTVNFDPLNWEPTLWTFGRWPKTPDRPSVQCLAGSLYHLRFAHISMSVFVCVWVCLPHTGKCMWQISYRGGGADITHLPGWSWWRGSWEDGTLTLMSDVTANLCYHRLWPGNDTLNWSFR